MNRFNTRWTPDLLDEVRRLVLLGLSMTQLGENFGTSRSAMAGLCHRHGIKVGSSRAPKARPVEKTPEQKAAARKAALKRAVRNAKRLRTDGLQTMRKLASPEDYVLAERIKGLPTMPVVRTNVAFTSEQGKAYDDAAPRLLLTDLRADQCKWPVSEEPKDPDFRYCGHLRDPDIRAPYCSHHNVRAYRQR